MKISWFTFFVNEVMTSKILQHLFVTFIINITISKLFEKLVDFERELHHTPVSPSLMATSNYTQRQTRSGSISVTNRRNMHGKFNNKPCRYQWSNGSNRNRDSRENHNTIYCHFCNFAWQETKECRKLSRFLRENQLTTWTSTTQSKASPTANVTTSF